MSKKSTYTATLQSNICGKKWTQEIQFGHRIYFISNTTTVVKEKHNKPGKEINVDDTKITCEKCGCSSGISNISHKMPQIQ
jgi:hypothetical protein